MASLKSLVESEADAIREGMAWVIIYRCGRSWHSDNIWLNSDDIIESEDAVMVNHPPLNG